MATPTSGDATPVTAGGTCPVRVSYLRQDQRLSPLGIHDVPQHSDFTGVSGQYPNVDEFVKKIFDEAKSWNALTWKHNGVFTKFKRTDAASGCKVNQYRTKKHDVWFARHSEVLPGGPSWEELEYALRNDHSRREAEYTDEIFDVNTLVEWDLSTKNQLEVDTGMRNITMQITEIYHGIDKPFTNHRVFTVLLLSGIRSDVPPNIADEFIIVQLPVDLATFPSAIISKSRRDVSGKSLYTPPNAVFTDKQHKARGKKIIQGYYASVEKVSRRKDSIIDWVMSTASDARGWVPKFSYQFVVPDKIAKDVEYVYKYVQTNRRNVGWPSAFDPAPAAAADPTSSPRTKGAGDVSIATSP